MVVHHYHINAVVGLFGYDAWNANFDNFLYTRFSIDTTSQALVSTGGGGRGEGGDGYDCFTLEGTPDIIHPINIFSRYLARRETRKGKHFVYYMVRDVLPNTALFQ